MPWLGLQSIKQGSQERASEVLYLAIGMGEGGSAQALAAAREVHPEQPPAARQLQVGRHRQRDVWATHVGTDHKVAWRLHHLHHRWNVFRFYQVEASKPTISSV